jgi:hypothetical protein
LLYRLQKKWAITIFILMFLVLSTVSIVKTREVPRGVNAQYQTYIDAWQGVDTAIPMCIVGNDVYGQMYYFYHFLNPGKHLQLCSTFSSERRPRWIYVSRWQTFVPAKTCSVVRFFSFGDKIYYCP